MKSSLRTVDDHGNIYTALAFVCPGCVELMGGGDGLHMLPVNSPQRSPQWDWDGDLDAPTVSPSILSRFGPRAEGEPERVCHSFLRAGVFEFLGDCTHSLAGQHVPMPDLPDWLERSTETNE